MSRWSRAMVWGGGLAIVWAALVRLMTMISRVPWWDIDPTSSVLPEATLTPSLSLVLDGVVWLSAGSIVLGNARSIRRRDGALLLLVLFGSLGAALHGSWLTPIVGAGGAGGGGWWSSLIVGSAWSSAMIGAWAISVAGQDRELRRALAALLLGASVMLVAKGAHQVFLEHPELLRQFNADPDGTLRAIGIEPGSTSALLYERRMRHADATGWSGLSNAYGSLLAAVLVASGAVLFRAIVLARRGRLGSGEAGLLGLVVVACAVGLALAGSKGAWGAVLIGLALLLLVSRPGRLGDAMRAKAPIFALALPALILLGVVLRGLVGERIGELSVLFRWHYMQGSARIIAEHPITGVGPASFKDAYLLARPPLSPEEIESPHSLPLDWLATLGLFGLAWVFAAMSWLRGAGLALVTTADDEAPASAEDGHPSRRTVIAFGAGVGASLIAAIWVAWGALVPTEMLALTVGAILWVAGGQILIRADRLDGSVMRLALPVGAITLLTHSMIEVTPVLRGTSAWCLALLALSSVGGQGDANVRLDEETSAPSFRRFGIVAALVLIGFGAIFTLWSLPRAVGWERELHRAAREVEPLARVVGGALAVELAPLSERADLRRAFETAVLAASREAGLDPPSSDEDWAAFRAQLERETKARAIEHLVRASEIVPNAPEPTIRAARLTFELALLEMSPGREPDARALSQQSSVLIRSLVERTPASSGAWAQLAALLEARGELLGDADDRAEAIDAWRRVSELDPYGLRPAVRLALLHEATGHSDQARAWARRALELDRLKRLDPLRRLDQAERQRLARLAEGPD